MISIQQLMFESYT